MAADLDFEGRLIEALQPIRGFFLAQILFHFLNRGWASAIDSASNGTVESIAIELDLEPERLRGLIQYLANEGFVVLDVKDEVSLTDRFRQLREFEPWYTLLIGGYGRTFLDLPDVVRSGGPYAVRDSSAVGAGSCGISQFDALPITRQLLHQIEDKCQSVVDIGCGDGSYLVDLCTSLPHLQGIGLDSDPISAQFGNETATERNLTERVHVYVGDSPNDISDVIEASGVPCFILAFVLQEILEQVGRTSVLEMLREMVGRFPDAYWIVVEVDHRPENAAIMSQDLALAYYNPYYLIHRVTQQRLETTEFWESLFDEAGLSVIAVQRADRRIDPLGLKVGYLLHHDAGLP